MPLDLALRPMSTSQILDRTFQVYRSNFWLFAGIAALPPALILIVQLVGLSGGALLARFGSAAWGAASIVTLVLGGAVFVVFYLAGYALAIGATVYAVSQIHLGSPVSLSAAYGAVRPLLLRILGIMLRVGLMAGAAFMVCYLAGIVPTFALAALLGRGAGVLRVVLIFLLGFAGLVGGAVWSIRIYCRYSLAVPACVVERLRFNDSLQRSKFLSQQSLLRIFLIYLLLGILAVVLSLVFSLPNYIALAMTPGVLTHGGVEPLILQIWSIIAGFLAGTLAGPIGTIAIALVYYDQRVRKEAFDLQLMMAAIGQPSQQQAAGAAAPGIG
jgi:hypothetical protein